YALADNRTAEFSSRDELKVGELLRSLGSDPDYPLEATGYTDEEVDQLLERLGSDLAGDSDEPEESDDDDEVESYVVRIEVSRGVGDDKDFRLELESLCKAYGAEFTIKPKG
ncbi:hypothetical protein ACYOEI_40420, partial [Singulisphaera rosea]